jgi:excisionase family DNA binding protein
MAYTTRQVADILKISKPTLLRWIREGIIPDAVKDGRGWRVWTDEDVEKVKLFMENYRQFKEDSDSSKMQKIRDYENFHKRSKY